MPVLKFAVFQASTTVGAVEANADNIIHAAIRAKAMGADILVTPECVLGGYPAEDLWLSPAFLRSCDKALGRISASIPIPAIVGHPMGHNGKRFNALSWCANGVVEHTYHKCILPNDSVFDEQRYFHAGEKPLVVHYGGVNIALLICEDIWHTKPLHDSVALGAEVAVVINASPFNVGKVAERVGALRDTQKNVGHNLPILYANAVGGQDELIFDGASFAMNAKNINTDNINLENTNPIWTMPRFAEGLSVCTYTDGKFLADGADSRVGDSFTHNTPLQNTADIYAALSLGLTDYLRKNGINKVLLGLSGGIDSAVTVAIAAQVVGAKNVHAVMMPSPYTSSISLVDAKTIADNLGVRYSVLSIREGYETLMATLAPEWQGRPPDIAEENLQARIRGVLLMALSNKWGGVVVNTSNKSEMATGYGTLYGDMVGGFALLKDVYKMQVFDLAHYINSVAFGGKTIIPERVITRPPSAELRADQTDQDSLPPYDTLDALLSAHLEGGVDKEELIAQSHDKGGTAKWDSATVEQVMRLLSRNEYKRRQAAIGPRITTKGFGKDMRVPITQKYF